MSADIKVTYSKEVSTIWHMPENVALCSSQKMFNQRHIEDPNWSKKKKKKKKKETKIGKKRSFFVLQHSWLVSNGM